MISPEDYAPPSMSELRDLWVDNLLNPLPREVGIELVPAVQDAFDAWLEHWIETYITLWKD